ncbi:MHYT domain-containing protein [Colwellia sp. 1_MG-2023]|uniref:MHYT domain-containing protein n=1 Tax=Colwellia sp. 1_MG-2023 TaxID=3062649 RepID=UPI0026E1D47D|nr:MHYT domain-containing protein [Colwellia sp. 1_MG-2023]MDO6445429.1 MHYT domain-containing protein [Colwellia sp. 1_MG-2023]
MMKHIHFFSFEIDKSTALLEEYNLTLVIVSYLVAVLAGYSATLINDFITTKQKERNVTLIKVAGGITLGIGVWSMHFIGMLALNLKMPIKYDALTTLISILPAILASISIIHFLNFEQTTSKQIICNGLLLAIGISAMHFIGMAAMTINAVMVHDPIIFVVAILASWFMATITIALKLKKISFVNRLSQSMTSFLSALTFGFSVATMHYIAMQSAYFFPTIQQSQLSGVNIDLLEKAVLSGIVFLLLSLSIVLYFKNKITILNDRAKQKDIQILDTVENMSEPFVFTDENGKILLVNNSFRNNFEKVNKTINIKELLRQFVNDYVSNNEALIELANKEAFEVTLRAINDKVWLFRKAKTTSGNYIYTWIDITFETKRQEELIQAKDLSIKTLEQLHNTQEKLAESKRLASIGKLVSNVAHELNTPLGVSITALSCLKETTETLSKAYSEGKLTKQSLSNYFSEFEECERLTKTNLNRASKLIERFKLISKERYQDEKSKVNLEELFNTLKHCLNNEINDIKVNVKFEVSGVIQIETYQDLLLQVIRILFENTIVHGFHQQNEGDVTIYALEEPEHVLIAFKDSGSGVDNEIKDVIFEPFTSSKRFDGNTGLGLHIAHNIIYQQLGGELFLKESNSKGSLFHILLPLTLPAKF